MKLATWNIQWGRGADGRVDLGRIVDDARRFGDFDVLCLQEVSAGVPELAGCDGRDQFVEIATRLPGYTAVSGIAIDGLGASGRRRQFGNMILSRYPVMQVFRHLLPWPPDPGVLSMQRIALETTLATPLGPLRVTTTHLEYYSAKQRHAQVIRLRELQQEAVAHAHAPRIAEPSDGPFFGSVRAAPAILTGDFNFLPDSPERALLMSAIDPSTPSYQDTWEATHRGEQHAPTVGLHDKKQWPDAPFTFDYIFASSDLMPRVRRTAVDAVSAASDHQPMMIELA
jgi:endonuclease/exonuclease/phosphatase family metal-dependent hydrolase